MFYDDDGGAACSGDDVRLRWSSGTNRAIEFGRFDPEPTSQRLYILQRKVRMPSKF
jgi:hypothetical protein